MSVGATTFFLERGMRTAMSLSLLGEVVGVPLGRDGVAAGAALLSVVLLVGVGLVGTGVGAIFFRRASRTTISGSLDVVMAAEASVVDFFALLAADAPHRLVNVREGAPLSFFEPLATFSF